MSAVDKDREKEKKSKRDETEEERRARKEREHAEKKARRKREEEEAAKAVMKEAKHETSERSEKKEKSEKKAETEEERRARKEKERAGRKAKVAAAADKPVETEEERRARKGKERAARKAKEKAEGEVAPATASVEASSASPPPPTAARTERDELVAAIVEENRTASRNALLSREADARSARQEQKEEDRDEQAKREQRRREQREERRRRKDREAAEAEEGVRDKSNGGSGRALGGEDGRAVGTSDTAAALRRQGYRGQFAKDLARATALRRLVDLDDTAAVIVDMAPQTAYDRYLRCFAESGRRLVAVQAPEEESRVEAAVQAERARMRNRSGQVPDDLGLYPEQYADRIGLGAAGAGHDEGGDGEANTKEHTTEEGNGNDSESTSAAARAAVPSVDAALLGSFLSRLLPVVSSIIDENLATGTGNDGGADHDAKARAVSAAAESFSAGCTTFAFAPLHNRPIVKTRFSPISPQYVAALYGPCTEGDTEAAGAASGKIKDSSQRAAVAAQLAAYPSVVLVWSVYHSAAPERVLVSFTALTCVCFSPTRPHLIYAGAEDGTLCLWDLREPDRSHLSAGARVGSYGAVPRLPSFTTAWRADNHLAAVCDICVASGAVSSATATGGDRNGGVSVGAVMPAGGSEQLLSLDMRGELRVWALGDRDMPTRAGAVSTGEHGLHIFASTRLTLAGVAVAASAADLDDGSGSASRTRRGGITGKAAAASARESDSDGAGSSSDADAYGALDHASVSSGAGAIVSNTAAGGGAGFLRWPCAAASRGCSLDVAPTDAARYVVAAAGGVRHRSRYGLVTAPAIYGGADTVVGGCTVTDLGLGPGAAALSAPLPTCVRYSSRDSRVLLVGYDDGTVRLFLQQQAAPQLVVAVSPAAAPVTEVRPAGGAAWLTWVLDESGCLYLLDHAHVQQRTGARLVAPLTTPETGACLCLDVPREEKALEGGLLAVGFGKGLLQVHQIDARKVLAPGRERDEKWL